MIRFTYRSRGTGVWQMSLRAARLHLRDVHRTVCPIRATIARVPICEDPRQYVGFDGQRWITLDELRLRHQNVIEPEEAGLHSIHTEPSFAIGERAFLLQTPTITRSRSPLSSGA
jgi:hypothetical protein